MAVKVLIVDDASFVRDLVKRTMRTHFPDVSLEEAINGRKAQILMAKTVFDLVLCDWEMPEMTGLELLQWARASEHHKTVPFIMVTSRGDRGHVLEAVQEGASDYLGKPFSAEQLLQKVTKAIGKKLRSSKGAGVSSNPLANNSASILTGAPVAPRSAAPVSDGTAALLAGAGRAAGLTPTPASPAPAASSASSTAASATPKGLAQIRFPEFNLPCIIKAISLTEIKVVARRGQRFPMILDPAVVDIEADEGQILERINGYVHQLQAVDKRMDTDFVSLIIRFVDEDPAKMASLSKFIEKFN